MIEMVRKHILTDRERRIVKAYLNDKTMLEDFRVLKHFIRSLDLSRLREDLELIERFLGET